MSSESKRPILSYGNPHRRDNGVDWRILEELRKRVPFALRLVTLQQLEFRGGHPIKDYDWGIFEDSKS